MPQTEDIGRGEDAGVHIRPIGRIDVERFLAPADDDATAAPHHRQRLDRIDPSPAGQVEAILARNEAADRIGLPIGRQHEKIGARPAIHLIHSGAI